MLGSNTSTDDNLDKVLVDNIRAWQCFDDLPKAVRQVIANMPVEFSVEQIAQEYASLRFAYFISDSEYAKHLDSNFREFVKHESYTKAERSPYAYKLSPIARKVHGRPGTARANLYR